MTARDMRAEEPMSTRGSAAAFSRDFNCIAALADMDARRDITPPFLRGHAYDHAQSSSKYLAGC
jgi:hypothetical protein